MKAIEYSRVHPLPAYDGPQPVYRAMPRWAGAVACYVRKGAKGWETAEPHPDGVASARFICCPVSTASNTRDGAVMAHDYYFGRERAS